MEVMFGRAGRVSLRMEKAVHGLCPRGRYPKKPRFFGVAARRLPRRQTSPTVCRSRPRCVRSYPSSIGKHRATCLRSSSESARGRSGDVDTAVRNRRYGAERAQRAADSDRRPETDARVPRSVHRRGTAMAWRRTACFFTVPTARPRSACRRDPAYCRASGPTPAQRNAAADGPCPAGYGLVADAVPPARRYDRLRRQDVPLQRRCGRLGPPARRCVRMRAGLVPRLPLGLPAPRQPQRRAEPPFREPALCRHARASDHQDHRHPKEQTPDGMVARDARSRSCGGSRRRERPSSLRPASTVPTCR